MQRGGQKDEQGVKRHRSTCKMTGIGWQLRMSCESAESHTDPNAAEVWSILRNIKLVAAAAANDVR